MSARKSFNWMNARELPHKVAGSTVMASANSAGITLWLRQKPSWCVFIDWLHLLPRIARKPARKRVA